MHDLAHRYGHQAGANSPYLWLLCPIALLTSPFGVKASFEGRSISSSVAETSEITARIIHFGPYSAPHQLALIVSTLTNGLHAPPLTYL